MMVRVLLAITLFWCSSVFAASQLVVNMSTVSGHQSIGTVTLEDSKYGLLIMPNLEGLSPGLHGFHVHQNPSCDDNGMAAGGHLDLNHTDKHLGPYNDKGHSGDLPVLYVDQSGKATTPILAPRLKLSDVENHALMIHVDGDNYADSPKPMGGGGARFACGVIPQS